MRTKEKWVVVSMPSSLQKWAKYYENVSDSLTKSENVQARRPI